MADENITSADTPEGAQQQASDAQILDDLTSLQQVTEGMDDAQGDAQVALNNEGDADNPSMTRPDDEFKDQRGLPEGGTPDSFALNNTDLQAPTEESTDPTFQVTNQTTSPQDATAINLDNVQITLDGAQGEQGTTGGTTTRSSTGTASTGTTTTTTATPTATPTTLTDPATSAGPTPTTPTTTPTTPTTENPPIINTTPSGSTTSGGQENSASTTTTVLSIFTISNTAISGWTPYQLNGQTVYISTSSEFSEPNTNAVNAEYIVLATEVGTTANGVPLITVLPYATQLTLAGTVQVVSTNGTATNSEDYNPIASSVQIASRFSTPIIDNAYKENQEQYTVSITPNSYTGTTTSPVQISTLPVTTFINDDEDPTIITLNDPAAVPDGTTNLTITASVSNPVTGQPLIINLSNGATITIPVGETTGTSTPFAEQASNQNLSTEIYSISIAEVSGGNYEKIESADVSTVTVFRSPELSIWKTGSVVEGGDNDAMIEANESLVSYSVIVQNTGNQTLSGLTLTDTKLLGSLDASTPSDATDLYTVGDTVRFEVGSYSNGAFTQDGTNFVTGTLGAGGVVTLTGVSLAPGQALNLKYDYVITQSDLNVSDTADGKAADNNAELLNLATADSTQTDPAASDTDGVANDGKATYVVDLAKTPELSIWKTGSVVEGGDNDAMIEANESLVSYSVIVQNTGNQTLSGLTLTDTKLLGSLDASTPSDATDLYTVGDTVRFEVGSYSNGAFTQDGTNFVTGTLGAGGVVTLTGVSLAPGQALNLKYDYVITQSDLNVSDTADGKAADNNAELLNLATADSTQTDPAASDTDGVANDGKATYVVDLEKISDVAISKFADTKFVNGVGNEINYTLTVRNEGNTTLTNVRIDDTKILGAVDEALNLEGLQFYGIVYTFDPVTNSYKTTEKLFGLDANNDIIIGNLEVNQYVDIDYTYIVKSDDIVGITSVLETSVLDYVQVGKRGSGFDSIDMGYGTFKAYQSQDAGIDYDRNTADNIAAKVFVNVDNTGTAVGVNAGVMAGIRNGYSDHLRADFTQSSVKQGTIVFTNAKDVELAFEAKYGAAGGSVFVGVIKITEGGDISLHSYSGTTLSVGATSISNPVGGPKTYRFTGVDIGNNTFTLSEVFGPGLAQNKIYTLNFSAGGEPMKSFDFWVEGDLRQPTATEQIKVVDVEFRSETITYNNISNIATVLSDQDTTSNTDGQSDEIDRFDVAVTGGSLTGAASSVIKSFGAFAPKVNSVLTDDTTPTITGSAKLSTGETLEVALNGIVYSTANGKLTYNAGNESWSIAVDSRDALGAGTYNVTASIIDGDTYRDWETDRKSTRLNSSHSAKSRMPSSA